MWGVLFFVSLSSPFVLGQRSSRQNVNHGNGWDIRLAVPGEPGNDYPTLAGIPKTSFSCAGKSPGYYADYETNCQAFRVCTVGSTFGFQSFLCPNGTLFNPTVFVCDWWMNVNCDSSQQQLSNNNQKFGNLKMGQQLMNDVKKMIMHPMRNPYDKSTMKSNLVVMQEYRPPSGQLFGPRKPDSLYVPAKQGQGFRGNGVSDNLIAASTGSPLYSTPLQNSNIRGGEPDAEVFQRQRQNGQYVHAQNGQYFQNGNVQNQNNFNGQFKNSQRSQQSGNLVSNGHTGQFTAQNHNTGFNNIFQQQQTQRQNNYQGNFQSQFNGIAGNLKQFQTSHQQGQINKQNAQYNTGNTINSQSNAGKQSEFGISFTKQQYNTNQVKQDNQQPQFSSEFSGKGGNEAKQNLVSNGYGPATVIAKTLTFNRIIQEPKSNAPKSRITFKTWIVKPSKTARLVSEPTGYSYNKPTNPPPLPSTEKLRAEPTAYYYNPPTTYATSEKLRSEPEPYYYNPPKTTTQSQKIVEQGPYFYNKPTSAKQIASTSPPSTTPSRQYLTPSPTPTASSTLPARLYIPPTTYKPLARLYLPASVAPTPSRQYLGPRTDEVDYDQNAKLQASPTSPTPVVVPAPSIRENPFFSLIKHSRINTNHNNLTFTDILTKEKLDITVNDIVKDTRNILGTASPEPNTQDENVSQDYNENTSNYVETESFTDSGETLSSATPTNTPSKSSKIIVPPADLLPPEEDHINANKQSNKISNLPYFKESNGPTIERTVSLKISIPEKTANYLFKTTNGSDYDKLEILNTGSSNYLVLTNKFKKTNTPSFIPIGKLKIDKNTNISDSQALVFSFLADSINQVKEYSNLAEQNLFQTTSQAQFNNINNEELQQITNNVAQLTSAQYTSNNNNANTAHNSNTVITSQAVNTDNQLGSSAKYTNNQAKLLSNAQTGHPQSQQNVQTGQFYSSRFQSGTKGFDGSSQINNNQNQIYSGQLYQVPVPDVSGIYNGQSSGKLIIQNNIQQQNSEVGDLHQNTNSVNNNRNKESSAEVEIIQSHSLPVASPAKLQTANQESNSFNSQEDSSQSLFRNFVQEGKGIAAQLRDKIIGTIPHPLEENKLVTYKKDQSYYVYTKLDNFNNVPNSQTSPNNEQQSGKLTQSNGDLVTFQLVPSVSYQLEDESEQQKLLNTFQIDEFGNPKGVRGSSDSNNELVTNVDYSVQHTNSPKQNGQFNAPNALYAGPSSYSAPQSSVGNLNRVQSQTQNASPAKLEQLEDNHGGYSKLVPTRLFNF